MVSRSENQIRVYCPCNIWKSPMMSCVFQCIPQMTRAWVRTKGPAGRAVPWKTWSRLNGHRIAQRTDTVPSLTGRLRCRDSSFATEPHIGKTAVCGGCQSQLNHIATCYDIAYFCILHIIACCRLLHAETSFIFFYTEYVPILHWTLWLRENLWVFQKTLSLHLIILQHTSRLAPNVVDCWPVSLGAWAVSAMMCPNLEQEVTVSYHLLPVHKDANLASEYNIRILEREREREIATMNGTINRQVRAKDHFKDKSAVVSCFCF